MFCSRFRLLMRWQIYPTYFSNFPFLKGGNHTSFFLKVEYILENLEFIIISWILQSRFSVVNWKDVYFFRKSLRSYQAQLLQLGPLRSELCRSGARAAQLDCLQQAWRFWGTKNGGKHRSVGELLQGSPASMIAKNKGFPGHHFGNERICIEIHRPFQAG